MKECREKYIQPEMKIVIVEYQYDVLTSSNETEIVPDSTEFGDVSL